MSGSSPHGDWFRTPETTPRVVQFHLLGTPDLDVCLGLQRRLAYEAGGHDAGRIVVVLCEHPPVVSIGRAGSRVHIELTNEQLRSRQLGVRWVSRGGGCILHVPGQLAIYPVVPLAWHGWTVGQYLARLQQALSTTLNDLRIAGEAVAGSFGLWGRTGVLATVGVAVKGNVTSQGAFLNVNPTMTDFPFVHVADPRQAARGRKTTMGSILAERRQAVTIPKVRAALVPNLAAAFDCEQYHLFTGHPWLPLSVQKNRPVTHRAN